MSDVTNVMFVGVGGQGTVLITAILAQGLVAAGFDVKMSEIHGMAQRGGSVSSQVRFGDVVYSPIISKGGADVLLSLETMEALRWLEFVKPSGKVIVNDHEIASVPILMGQRDYPRGVIDILKSKVDTTSISALDIANEIGDPRVANLVLFGALVETIGLTDIDWEPVIAAAVKATYLDRNLDAYRAGRRVIERNNAPAHRLQTEKV
ncbi:MAG: indolepyruvate oxidoreductase subunit beta [Rhizomicrobium sp.]